ncbi:putative ubiquitin carboxyl-terminal hydrolase creB, partial [Nibea albiflora]
LPLSVYEQKDAAEYFEKILRLSSSGASQIFHGELTHKTICSGCFAEAVRDGAFWHLPLALVDSNSEYSVVDGIENYFKALEFSGEDQIYCENCDNKSDTTIKRVIKHHPDVLMLLLKRFEFNYSYMTYVKNYHTVVVPFTLQIPENQTYELYAVVDHFGDLRSGHYTATIKDDEGWYTFNDRWVKPFKEETTDVYLILCINRVIINHSITLKLSAADAEDSMETSTPEVILPATRQDDYDYDQCQDGKMRMREEAEEAEEEEDQDTKSCNDHESNEETKYYQDPHPNKQRHKEDVGGNAQAGEQAEKRESGHQVIQSSELEESVEVQDRDSGKQRTAEAEVSDRHEVHDRNKDDEVSSTKRSVMETGGKSEDDEQPERKGPSLIKYPDRAVDYQDNEDNAREGLRGTQEAGQDDDVKPVSVQMEGNTGEGERSSEGEKLFELQDNRREGDSEESMPGDDQTRKQDNSRMSNIPEQQRQDKIYVKEHKDGDDKHVEDQNNEGNIRQNQPEQKISVTHAEQKDVGVKRQTEEQGNTREEHVRDKADSSLRGAGSAGSGRMTENQQVGDDEKMRMREEAEEAEEEGNVTMVTEMKDTVGSTEVGQPPELCNTEEDQDTKSYNDHESNEETNYYQDTHPNKQRD